MNKLQYMMWKTDWKQSYAELSQKIRNLKNQRKVGTDTEKAYLQRDLHYLRADARQALEERTKVKEEYHGEWLKRHQARLESAHAC